MLFVCSHIPWRLLESRPPFTTILYEYPGPANYHRGVWFLWNAQGLLPLPAGWLETWDSGDVWPTQGQRKGKKEKKKHARKRRHAILNQWTFSTRASGQILTRPPSGLICITGKIFLSWLYIETILQDSGVTWNSIDFFFLFGIRQD